MPAAKAVCSSQARAATASLPGCLPDYPVPGNSGLPNHVSQVLIPFIAHHWFFLEFGARGRIDPQVVPRAVDDLLQVRQVFVVSHDQWDSSGRGLLLIS